MEELEDTPTDEEKATYKEAKKKGYEGQFILDQCVDASNFEEIAMVETSKDAWDIILSMSYAGVDKLKKVKRSHIR